MDKPYANPRQENYQNTNMFQDLINLNDACMHDPFSTPFTDEVLEGVGSQEMYSFTNGFVGYHQIRIAKEDRHKTTFITKWVFFSIHSDALWVEECTCDILSVRCRCIQIFYSEISASIYG